MHQRGRGVSPLHRGFTLLELLVVVGIMSMLGIAETSGYSALQRGMAERGAVAVAATVLRAAQERANVDRLPTAVFCYNRLLKAPTSEGENGVVVGVMVAVRRSGRLSYVKGDLLFDEFADLDTTYEAVDDVDEARKGGSFRLFKFGSVAPKKMEYSIVADKVITTQDDIRITLFSGTGDPGGETNLYASAFLDLGSGTISSGSWSVGDGYAFVFAETQLPKGFIFGQSVPTDPGKISELTPLVFSPDENSNETVPIWSTLPDASGYPKAVRKAGEASAKSEKAV